MNATGTTPDSGSTPMVAAGSAGAAPRRIGRPSTVDQLSAMVMDWLQADPMMTGAEALLRARDTGYRGGKSAFYDLLRRLRFRLNTDHRAA